MSAEIIMNYASFILLGVAILCTFLSIVTEFTKQLGFLNKIPTDLQVLILSIIVCIIAYLAYASYTQVAITWYVLVAVIAAAFVVAIICCKGWSFVIDIWKRFYKKAK